jgi:hypothetical protein
VSLITPDPEALTPDSVPTTVEVQLNVVDPMLEVGKKFSGVPLQICCMNDDGEFVITGLGVTLTVTVIELPEQPLAIGVIM